MWYPDTNEFYIIQYLWMIKSFKHKGIKELFVEGRTNKINLSHQTRVRKLLAMIHAAHNIRDLDNNPGLRLHKLKKPPYNGYWSLDVIGNFRIIFRFSDGNATDLNYLDTH